MLVRSGRRLAAGIVAVLACAALTVPSAASAAGGTYTQILCADPDSGAGVIPDSQLPDGMTNPSTFPSMSTASTTAGCTSGSGIALPTAADTNDPYKGGALVYRAGDGVKFQRAMLHRRYLDQSNWSLFVHRAADWTWAYASPFTERCDAGCAQLGSGEGFATSTRTLVAAGSEETNGFSFAVLCEIPDSTRRCTADGSRGLRLWGGRVTLEDAANPQVSGTPSGSLVRETVLRDGADLTFSATDVGSGLYRVRVLLDGEPRLSQVIDANNGRCADVLPSNGDPYEFAHRRPCKASVGGTYEFDTRTLPDGPVRLAVQVEDAAGNATTLRSEQVTIDNVRAPSVASDPVVSGTPRRGSSLAVSPATWDTHGAASALSVARVWQRCRRDGSTCVDIPGASGLTYELGADDVARRLRVVETATNAEGSTAAASALSALVTREDGTLPPGEDGLDNDGDGEIDEPDEGLGKQPVDPAKPAGPATPSGGSFSPRPTGERASSESASANGEGASARAVLTVRYASGAAAARTIAYGRSAEAVGRLVDEHGRPVRNAIVDVASTSLVGGARPVALAPAVTGADGSFRYTISGRGPNRGVEFGYRFQREGSVVSSARLGVTVRAGVRLSVALAGSSVRYRGQVLAGTMPRTGKLVLVQGRSAGGRWQTFASRRARGKGTFSGRYRLKVRHPGRRLQFRVRAVRETGWPYAEGVSKVVTRRVR